ncbi:MAG: KpsF/GutQ family sugar-phosphate isomerase [Candidatus Coatesbacteria bacterium]|nr:KpsF/GutQ family sugar-phosphate isomerase [Candidatus Coatesbacteria bacterium]
MPKLSDELLEASMREAERLLREEAEAVAQLACNIGDSFRAAIELLATGKGKTFISGLGKSGLVGRKIAATLSSTGTPAYFIHPVEALHGDIGMVSPEDRMIAISHSGSNRELLEPVRILKERNVKVISMTSNPASELAKLADVFLDIGVQKEACPLGLAPTTSTTATLAMGDAIAAAMIIAKGIKRDDFARYHPSGALGRRLLTKVRDVMHARDSVARVSPNASIRETVTEMTRMPLGAVCIVDQSGNLLGIVTDGDVRRILLRDNLAELLEDAVSTVMTKDPIKVCEGEMASIALSLMEDRKSQISVLPVVSDDSNEMKGLIRLHDLIRLGMK